MANLIFITEQNPGYALLGSGDIVPLPEVMGRPMLEVSDQEQLLRIRKKMWEANWLQTPTRTIRPPWMA